MQGPQRKGPTGEEEAKDDRDRVESARKRARDEDKAPADIHAEMLAELKRIKQEKDEATVEQWWRQNATQATPTTQSNFL